MSKPDKLCGYTIERQDDCWKIRNQRGRQLDMSRPTRRSAREFVRKHHAVWVEFVPLREVI